MEKKQADMTPKEKAEQLVGKMASPENIYQGQMLAKQCALIAVDAIISEIEPSISMDVIEARINYWQQVKQEIEKL